MPPARQDLSLLFPDTPPPEASAIRDHLRGVRVDQPADPRLHFELLAPPGWIWRTPEETNSPPGLLLSLVDGSPERAEITVVADDLRREVNPADWVKSRLAEAGHTLLAARESPGPSGTGADLFTGVDTHSAHHLARSNTVKDGARIFTVTCRAREDLHRERAADFFAVLASFTLLAPERAPLAEPLASFTYIYPAVLGFRYPTSWQLEQEITGIEECDVRLDTFHDGRCAGRIYVQARARRDASSPDAAPPRPARLVPDFVARMRGEGLLLETTPDLTPVAPPEGFERAFFAAVPTSREGAPAELRLTTLETETATLLVAVRGPSASGSPYWWAVDKRAYEIVLESLHAV